MDRWREVAYKRTAYRRRNIAIWCYGNKHKTLLFWQSVLWLGQVFGNRNGLELVLLLFEPYILTGQSELFGMEHAADVVYSVVCDDVFLRYLTQPPPLISCPNKVTRRRGWNSNSLAPPSLGAVSIYPRCYREKELRQCNSLCRQEIGSPTLSSKAFIIKSMAVWVSDCLSGVVVRSVSCVRWWSSLLIGPSAG